MQGLTEQNAGTGFKGQPPTFRNGRNESMRTMIRGVLPSAVKVAIAVFLAAGLLGCAGGQTRASKPPPPPPAPLRSYSPTTRRHANLLVNSASNTHPTS